jgi:hypothetical protein
MSEGAIVEYFEMLFKYLYTGNENDIKYFFQKSQESKFWSPEYEAGVLATEPA